MKPLYLQTFVEVKALIFQKKKSTGLELMEQCVFIKN